MYDKTAVIALKIEERIFGGFFHLTYQSVYQRRKRKHHITREK